MADKSTTNQSTWSKITHWIRPMVGLDPHKWQVRDTLHGVERAISKAANGGTFESSAVLGSGRLTRVWVCSCGESTEVEPESAFEVEP
jgi:hypothetical protein